MPASHHVPIAPLQQQEMQERDRLYELQKSSLNPHQHQFDQDGSSAPACCPDEELENLAPPNTDEPPPPLAPPHLTEDCGPADIVVDFLDEESKHAEPRTVTIFDWDDTLLPSSFLFSVNQRLDSAEVCAELRRPLRQIEEAVASLIRLALSQGPVYVITNAQQGWVELSARKWLPGVVPLLEHMHVMSARTHFEARYPCMPLKWKLCAMQQSLAELARQPCVKNVLSFGDSLVEREAVRSVTRAIRLCQTKSVKFAERPSLEQLYKQISLVTGHFSDIINHQGDLDLMLTISLSQGQSPETQQQHHMQQRQLLQPQDVCQPDMQQPCAEEQVQA